MAGQGGLTVGVHAAGERPARFPSQRFYKEDELHRIDAQWHVAPAALPVPDVEGAISPKRYVRRDPIAMVPPHRHFDVSPPILDHRAGCEHDFTGSVR